MSHSSVTRLRQQNLLFQNYTYSQLLDIFKMFRRLVLKTARTSFGLNFMFFSSKKYSQQQSFLLKTWTLPTHLIAPMSTIHHDDCLPEPENSYKRQNSGQPSASPQQPKPFHPPKKKIKIRKEKEKEKNKPHESSAIQYWVNWSKSMNSVKRRVKGTNVFTSVFSGLPCLL